jgi:hypothetical protein
MRPSSDKKGLNPQEREGKLASLRWDPVGPRPIVDYSIFGRPEIQNVRKDERTGSVYEGVPLRIPNQAPSGPGLRIRQEPNNRDAMNSRILEAMPYSASRIISPEENARKPYFQDMAGIPTRTSVGNYKQSQSFFPDAELQNGPGGSVIPQAVTQLPGRFTDNPYLQSMDAQNEPRQIMRELRGTVTEDNREKYIDFSQKMTDRNFRHSWLPPSEAEEQQVNNLQAYELLKPKFDNFGMNYRKSPAKK